MRPPPPSPAGPATRTSATSHHRGSATQRTRSGCQRSTAAMRPANVLSLMTKRMFRGRRVAAAPGDRFIGVVALGLRAAAETVHERLHLRGRRLGRCVRIITRTARSKALVVRGTGYGVDRVGLAVRASGGRSVSATRSWSAHAGCSLPGVTALP